MSTEINVTVDRGGLLKRNRQQTTANRQAAQEETQSTTAAATADAEREQRLQQERVDTRRLPVPSRDDLAAYRYGRRLQLGHLWVFQDDVESLPSPTWQVTTSRVAYGSIRGTWRYPLALISGDGSQCLDTYVGFDNRVGMVPTSDWTLTNTPTPDIGGVTLYRGRQTGANSGTEQLRYGYFCMPAGRGKFLLVLMRAWSWSNHVTNVDAWYEVDQYGVRNPSGNAVFLFTPVYDPIFVNSYTDSDVTTQVFLCTSTSITEIALPDTLKAITDVLNPAAAQVQVNLTYYNAVYGSYYRDDIANNRPYLQNTSILSAGYGFEGSAFVSVYTPEIFEVLNNLLPFVNAGEIKQPRPTMKHGLIDTSDGAYAAFQTYPSQGYDQIPFPWWPNIYASGEPFYHAIWPKANEEADIYVYDPAYANEPHPRPKRDFGATLKLSDQRVYRNGNGQFVVVDDWSTPSYCLAMLQALGFDPLLFTS